MTEKIGIFSGSFNPIHTGHLILANYICEFTGLDEVWFVVSPQNPFKASGDLLDDSLRLKMVCLALEGFERIKASDVEFHMPRPSYTIDTLTKLSEQYPDKEFILIIGSDNWKQFHSWKESDKLISNYRLLIYPRLGEDVIIPEELRFSVQIVDAPIVEISSTFIRESICARKNVRGFLPQKVYDFIIQNNLYQ